MAVAVSSRVRVAEGLSIVALIMLIIYGIDALVVEGGFLPMDEMSRGMIFGGGAVALSIAAFFISLKERSKLTSVLLIINGVLILIGGIISSQQSASAYGVLSMGIIVIIMGIIKIIRKA